MAPGPSRSHCPWDVCLVLVFLWLPFRPSAPSLCLSPLSLSLLSGLLALSAHLVLPCGSNLGLPVAFRRIS